MTAQIEGVSVSEPLSDVQTAFIKKIWHEHHIVLFREQNAEPREIIEFAGKFGNLDDHASTPYYRLENFPQLMEITTYINIELLKIFHFVFTFCFILLVCK